MGFPNQDKARIGRPAYWTGFVVNFTLVVGLLVAAVALGMNGHFGPAILCFLAIVPAGLYFRVIMMRRCRAIGWPAFLPWLMFGLGLFANLTRLSQGVEGLRNPGLAVFPMLVGLADFALMIAIGCIAGRGQREVAQVFEPDEDAFATARPLAQRSVPRGFGTAPAAPRVPQDFEPTPAFRAAGYHTREQEEASWDAAIARALEARQRDAGGEIHRPLAPPVQRTSGPRRPVAGFGRRVV